MARVLGAADIVVTRAGATTIMELAALAAPTILVPNAYLTGGHQLKNAAVYAEKEAVVVLSEPDLEKRPALLAETIGTLLSDADKLQKMRINFHGFAKPQAAEDVADMIISAVKKA
jgi:UDP-N-acetylglucosamine--N-acetylmuramyl-(pentapeptide) pyrophosphoryl-undecaprenol N-acetylglucosamine transferase